MGVSERTFAVASDQVLVGLIRDAKRRLVVVAPALSKDVAEAIVARLPDLGRLDITVILDADPEVYRLGFGEVEALEALRKASAAEHLGLREQPGVRIGVMIADDAMMIYAPVSKNIEAGSTSVEKPNAIMLDGGAARIAASVEGADEIGKAALQPASVEKMQADLKANPPKSFDIARKLNVFTSKVQYVEFEAKNYRLAKRQIPLPLELVDVTDDKLKARMNSRIAAPVEEVPLEITFGPADASETLAVDQTWLDNEKARIERDYTFPIPRFGRVILYKDKERFAKDANRFVRIVEAYQKALKAHMDKSRDNFTKQIVEEYRPRWRRQPSEYFKRWDLEPSAKNIEDRLTKLANDVFARAIAFQAPEVRVVFKNVSFENIQDENFLKPLKGIMEKRDVPASVINSLFTFGAAAPETGSSLASERG
jgi:hypothetical protein